MFGILVCGDSISFGRGESPSVGWSGRLKNYFEPQDPYNCVYDLGIPGDTTTTLLKRFETEVKLRVRYLRSGDKFVILLAIGINDSRGIETADNLQTPQQEFENNVVQLIQTAKKYTKHVVVIGLTPVDETITNPFEDTYFTNDRIQEYDGILKKVARNEETHYVDIFTPLSNLEYTKLLADGLHPNAEGYEEMYNIIKTFLVREKLIE